jgi:geranylgeranyl diphosphate synthase type II
MAFECICTSELPFEAVRKSCLILAQAAGAQGMVGGQMDDLLGEDRDPSQYDHAANARFLQAIHSRKTGAMIRASVELGGIAGGADPAQSDCLARFSHAIGIAFQIVDDLLDVESTLENTGKRTGKDQERGKLTFPGVYGIPASRERAHGLVAEAVAAVEPLGETARPLQQIARYILERSN